MNKIISKSKNGFQLDEYVRPNMNLVLTKAWFTLDKFKFMKDVNKMKVFNDLKVGDEVSNIVEQIGKDGKSYVISFDVVTPISSLPIVEGVSMLGRDGGKISPLENKNQNSLNSPSSVQALKSKSEASLLGKPNGEYFDVSGENIIMTPKSNNSISPDSLSNLLKKDGLMYGQSITRAFESGSIKDLDMSFNKDGRYINIEKAFDIADLIYNEMLKRLK